MLRAYEETIAMLTGWKPPLNLIFRRAPVREGWLKKSGVSKRKVRALTLTQGKQGKHGSREAEKQRRKVQAVMPCPRLGVT